MAERDAAERLVEEWWDQWEPWAAAITDHARADLAGRVRALVAAETQQLEAKLRELDDALGWMGGEYREDLRDLIRARGEAGE